MEADDDGAMYEGRKREREGGRELEGLKKNEGGRGWEGHPKEQGAYKQFYLILQANF